MANEDQIEAWNGPMGEKWAEQQDRMDALLEPLSRVAIERAGVTAGEVVLDIGCGCGASSLALAPAARSVVGYDVSADVTRRESARRLSTMSPSSKRMRRRLRSNRSAICSSRALG